MTLVRRGITLGVEAIEMQPAGRWNSRVYVYQILQESASDGILGATLRMWRSESERGSAEPGVRLLDVIARCSNRRFELQRE